MTRRQREQLNAYKKVNSIRLNASKLSTKQIRAIVRVLYGAFSDLPDCRAGNHHYTQQDVLAMILVGLLCKQNTLIEIETYFKSSPAKLRKWLGISLEANDIPTDTTMSTILANIEPLELMAVINEWSRQCFYQAGSARQICVDGKAIRASLRKILGSTHPPYILNAFDATSGAIDIQIEVGPKTNELGSMPDLFKILDLENATITMDAAGTNPEIARLLLRDGANYVLPLKGNQQTARDLATGHILDTLLSSDSPENILYSDTDNDEYQHGRITQRYYLYITDGVPELFANTSFEGLFAGVGMVLRINEDVRYDAETGERIPQEKTTQIVFYGSNKADMTSEEFARYVRCHWRGCETIHYVLDTEYKEDRSRLDRGYNRQNMSLLRKAVCSLTRYVKKNAPCRVSESQVRTWLQEVAGIPAYVIIPESDSA